MKLFKILLFAGSLCSVAAADVIQADYLETLALPYYGTGVRVEQLLGVTFPASSPQLTAADTISNPSKWNNSLNVSFDPTTDILSLTGDGDNDYQIITVTLSDLMFNVPGEIVTGITPISVGNAVYPDTGDSNDALTTTPFFTANSFGVTYSAANIDTTDNEFLIQGETDTFQVSFGTSSVPEPGTLGLTGIGAAVLLCWRRRKLRA